jgi:ornithine cyclodeaminase/alanine dehydrogenase-like protein (mu-crystallin family)
VLILNSDNVRAALPMPAAIAAMREAFAALSDGNVELPQRTHLAVQPHHGITLIMPAFVDGDDPAEQSLAVKVVSVFERNPAAGLAAIQAAVIVLDPATGRPVALFEGATLTALRTAAASGVATDLLARPDSRRLALFGAGVQARFHIEAMCAVRSIDTVTIYSRTKEKAHQVVSEFASRPEIRLRITVAESPAEALRDADIVCATTTARQPIFDDADLPAGAHVNAVGSFTPQSCEIPPATVQRAVVFVDSISAAWDEAGDLIQPLEAGLISRQHVRGELGELILGRKSGRPNDNAVTFFKSVGVAVQDAVAARYALKNARELNLGQQVPW